MMMMRIIEIGMESEKNSTDQSAERKSGTFAATVNGEILLRFRQTRRGGGDNREDRNDIVFVYSWKKNWNWG